MPRTTSYVERTLRDVVSIGGSAFQPQRRIVSSELVAKVPREPADLSSVHQRPESNSQLPHILWELRLGIES
jgi:hypothetical protein